MTPHSTVDIQTSFHYVRLRSLTISRVFFFHMFQFPNFENFEFSFFSSFSFQRISQSFSYFPISKEISLSLSLSFWVSCSTQNIFFFLDVDFHPPLMAGPNQRIVICAWNSISLMKMESVLHLLSVNNLLLIKFTNFSIIKLLLPYTRAIALH